MSWLLFLDESGHDHKTMPYEVRGGIAIHAGKLWPFVRNMQKLELSAFGTTLQQFGNELKGCKILDKKRIKWASQKPVMSDEERCKHCRGFLTKGKERKSPTRDEFTAYGQACHEMAAGVFQLLLDHNAKLFATAIPKNVVKPSTYEATDFLRKDHVFLLERYFYFLQEKQEHGLLVIDEVEKMEDRRFVRRLEKYFSRTDNGKYRSQWIVPSPFFVSSDMAYPIQAADIAIYCVNWGFRLPRIGMNAPTREWIAVKFRHWLNQLQYHGKVIRNEENFQQYGIVFVPDPYTPR